MEKNEQTKVDARAHDGAASIARIANEHQNAAAQREQAAASIQASMARQAGLNLNIPMPPVLTGAVGFNF